MAALPVAPGSKFISSIDIVLREMFAVRSDTPKIAQRYQWLNPSNPVNSFNIAIDNVNVVMSAWEQ